MILFQTPTELIQEISKLACLKGVVTKITSRQSVAIFNSNVVSIEITNLQSVKLYIKNTI